MTWAGESADGDRRNGQDRRTGTMVLDADERRLGSERRHSGATGWEDALARDEGLTGGTSLGRGGSFGADEATFAPGRAVYDDRARWDAGRTHRGPGPYEHDAIPSFAAIAGHPIHPMLVPIPIGALTLTIASDLAYAMAPDRFWAQAGRTLTAVGIVSGLAAASFGAMDFVARERVRDHREAWLHAGGNVAALALSGVSLLLRTRRRDPVPAPLALSLTAGAILMVTGWLGGELSYRHRVGVTQDPGGGR